MLDSDAILLGLLLIHVSLREHKSCFLCIKEKIEPCKRQNTSSFLPPYFPTFLLSFSNMSKHLFLLATLLPSLLSAVKAKSIVSTLNIYCRASTLALTFVLQCEIIEDVLPGMTELPGTSGYEEAQTEYHSETQMGLTPACRVSPKSAANVSTIIQEAVKNQSPFAVHSGGYFMSIGGSNIGDEGFTIDLAELNTVEIAADKKSVKVGSGNRWESVYNPLAEQGLHAVGGRDPGIGTGGYLLGGAYQAACHVLQRIAF